jgi:hypothetical protein
LGASKSRTLARFSFAAFKTNETGFRRTW